MSEVYQPRHPNQPPSHRKHGMGMEQIPVGFPPDLLEQLHRQANSAGMNRAAYLRHLVEQDGLERAADPCGCSPGKGEGMSQGDGSPRTPEGLSGPRKVG